ncbi:MAG TPA: hypothetical protein VGF82_08385 [Terracidiphilus sp.]
MTKRLNSSLSPTVMHLSTYTIRVSKLVLTGIERLVHPAMQLQ